MVAELIEVPFQEGRVAGRESAFAHPYHAGRAGGGHRLRRAGNDVTSSTPGTPPRDFRIMLIPGLFQTLGYAR